MQILTFKKYTQIIFIMGKTATWAIGLVLISTIFITVAQTSWKIAANTDNPILSLYLWLGFFAYGLTTVMLIIALKYGELSVLAPLNTTSYIWVALTSAYLFGEIITPLKWAGLAFVLLGVSLVSIGGKK